MYAPQEQATFEMVGVECMGDFACRVFVARTLGLSGLRDERLSLLVESAIFLTHGQEEVFDSDRPTPFFTPPTALRHGLRTAVVRQRANRVSALMPELAQWLRACAGNAAR